MLSQLARDFQILQEANTKIAASMGALANIAQDIESDSKNWSVIHIFYLSFEFNFLFLIFRMSPVK